MFVCNVCFKIFSFRVVGVALVTFIAEPFVHYLQGYTFQPDVEKFFFFFSRDTLHPWNYLNKMVAYECCKKVFYDELKILTPLG